MVRGKIRQKIAKISLACGLSLAFLYAAIGSLVDPATWIGYLPPAIAKLAIAPIFLKTFAIFEIILSLWLLSGKFRTVAATVAALLLIAIVLANISDLTIIFRDLALSFAALALVILP